MTNLSSSIVVSAAKACVDNPSSLTNFLLFGFLACFFIGVAFVIFGMDKRPTASRYLFENRVNELKGELTAKTKTLAR